MHRDKTMNYYHVDADETCWNGLKILIDQVNNVIQSAKKNGYPNFKEE